MKKRKGPQPRFNEEEIAAWEVNYYTLIFSKPYIHQLTRWFVVDGHGGNALDGGLITVKGRKKPNYYALRKLIKLNLVERVGEGRAAYYILKL